tara:strand:- start:558 stop:770 length:213 start_codon:yes stop_codon:yes gene_type:complete
MRASEFIRALADVIDALDNQPSGVDDEDKNQQNPVMVAPQQQALELQKATLGKVSPIISKLVTSSNIGEE